MGELARNIGLTTTCNVGVERETRTFLFQSTLISLGWLGVWARQEIARTRTADDNKLKSTDGLMAMVAAVLLPRKNDT